MVVSGVRGLSLLRILIPMVLLVGCGRTSPPQFRFNAVEYLKQEKTSLGDDEHFSEEYKYQIGALLTALFGTPDDPKFPEFLLGGDPSNPLISIENLQMAAGPVSSDRDNVHRGLYREHCVHCHGITGDGAGPTATTLNPYPRDFRLGKFKFKSTPLRVPPTDDDLTRVLREGIPGTAMPAFKTLPSEQIEALVDYVKYLSIRGEYERYLIAQLPLLEGDPLIDLSALPQTDNDKADGASSITPRETDTDLEEEIEDQLYELVGDMLVDRIIERWRNPDRGIIDVPPAPSPVDPGENGHRQFVLLGQDLFYGKANCLQCHGNTGLGDGQTQNYDDWTNEWLKSPGVDITDPTTYDEFLSRGALPPRAVRPRNLNFPVYRGGGRYADLYRRIANGIEGTPMPSSPALTPEEIWALVAYVKSLPFDRDSSSAGSH